MDCDHQITQSPDYPILFGGNDADNPTHCAVVFELHAAGDLRKDRVVLADAGVETRPESTAALADDDRAAADQIPVVRLCAEPLRIGIPTVS